MCTALPSDNDITAIFNTRSQWWKIWRETFGLAWGDEEDNTLEKFATRAVRSENPSLLGSLLLCFALSTGDHGRYLAPVERWIMADNRITDHEYDFQCLMALGLCFLSALQPRRAWIVYRKANTLLQLAGIHRLHRKSESLDTIFWQLFGEDRWVSLLIGLPYSVPDHLCDLYIPPIDQASPVSFHYQHMTVLTGRVIDSLQSNTGVSLAAVVGVDEQIDKITAQLPPDFLDMAQISIYPEAKEKSARLYRITQIHQLKTFLYLPLFLQHCEGGCRKSGQSHSTHYARTACTSSARTLLEAFLALYDIDPSTASVDNSMKLTSFSALSAAVVLFLNLLADSQATSDELDKALISRTVAVFLACSEGQPRSLCGQCHTALEALVSCSQSLDRGARRQISVPYFGLVQISRRNDGAQEHSRDVNPASDSRVPDQPQSDDNLILLPTLSDDMFFSYNGPWENHEQDSFWSGQGIDAGIDWMNMDFSI
ncbi:hypothetical protein ASPWEDRAFT_193946 [Aspergillus wentii DTO 134E9]|uniref:Transcription factor domain-containing protein n=1 Tax=Aspergillus wentii DTO 134E9 TaxID=1073089 RepID=A0A1L9RZH7_ASPWE|nr:uncharacterized protein ASPWEDRAFT_193946 [Aspergillus wentii DTO 134E9]KAI9932645.1 hypothetical protein MW887_008894 [Aspergillus wentii]OJJ40218.1 hypothetical protein ASPWEDRAFT_193946 [Aspergillus wentii DTO 134E9]